MPKKYFRGFETISLVVGRLNGLPGTQLVKNPPATLESWVQSLSWEHPLEEGMAIHSNILAWRIPMDPGAWQVTDHGVAKSHTQLSY